MEDTNIGEEILKNLKKELLRSEYDKYIKNIRFAPKEYKKDLAVFYAPNPFIASWTNTKYSSTISHLFEIKTGIKPKIIIKALNDKKNKFMIKNSKNSKIQDEKTLIAYFTFDNFVVGQSNDLAYSASLNIAKRLGKAYNPFFIYGGVGLGKTHLAQAIANYNNHKNSVYTTSEQFLNDFTRNLKNNTMEKFKEKYRKCDLLIIDDIQFLSGKEETQMEVFHTFNELYEQNKQIVIIADRMPKDIIGIEDRLRNRFESGLTVNISPPLFETKIAIINKKCELNKINLSNEIISYIAKIIKNNVREIEGIISKLHAHSTIMNEKIDLEFTKQVLEDQIKEKKEIITMEDILNLLSNEFNLKQSEIKSKNKTRNIVNARRIAIYLARELTTNSTPKLAKYFNLKDHTAIVHNIKKINENLNKDENFKLKIRKLQDKLSTKK